jgi:hypothetical protein
MSAIQSVPAAPTALQAAFHSGQQAARERSGIHQLEAQAREHRGWAMQVADQSIRLFDSHLPAPPSLCKSEEQEVFTPRESGAAGFELMVPGSRQPQLRVVVFCHSGGDIEYQIWPLVAVKDPLDLRKFVTRCDNREEFPALFAKALGDWAATYQKPNGLET